MVQSDGFCRREGEVEWRERVGGDSGGDVEEGSAEAGEGSEEDLDGVSG